MARFFTYPLNYIGNRVYNTASPPVFIPAAQDNDYNTSTRETTLDVNIDSVGDGTGTAQIYSAVFLKCTGVASFDVTATGGSPASYSVTIPAMLPLYNEPVADLRGVQNYLHLLNGTGTAQVLRFAFTPHIGQTATIQELMVLQQILTIDENDTSPDRPRIANIEYTRVERGAVIQEDITGRLSKAPPLNNARAKYRVDYTTRYKNRQDLERMLNFKEDYDVFCFAPNYELYPHLVLLAQFANLETPIRYVNTWTLGPRTLEFTIDER